MVGEYLQNDLTNPEKGVYFFPNPKGGAPQPSGCRLALPLSCAPRGARRSLMPATASLASRTTAKVHRLEAFAPRGRRHSLSDLYQGEVVALDWQCFQLFIGDGLACPEVL